MFYIAINKNTNELLFDIPLEDVKIEAPSRIRVLAFETLEEAEDYIYANSLKSPSYEAHN